MKTMVIFLSGVSVDRPFTFSNAYTISKLGDLPDGVISDNLLSYINHDDSYVLYKTVPEDVYKRETFDQGVFTLDMISLCVRGSMGVKILAASAFFTSNVPNVPSYGFNNKLEKADLERIDNNIIDFQKRSQNEKKCIEVSLMYLNKSKTCLVNVNGNFEHAIFLRVALENCFDAPKQGKRSAVAKRAEIILNQFDPKEVNREFKRIYDQASAAVHTGKVPRAPKNNRNERKVRISDYYIFDLLEMSIETIIRNGFPRWEENTMTPRARAYFEKLASSRPKPVL